MWSGHFCGQVISVWGERGQKNLENRNQRRTLIINDPWGSHRNNLGQNFAEIQSKLIMQNCSEKHITVSSTMFGWSHFRWGSSIIVTHTGAAWTLWVRVCVRMRVLLITTSSIVQHRTQLVDLMVAMLLSNSFHSKFLNATRSFSTPQVNVHTINCGGSAAKKIRRHKKMQREISEKESSK